jgi:hypothetical protein
MAGAPESGDPTVRGLRPPEESMKKTSLTILVFVAAFSVQAQSINPNRNQAITQPPGYTSSANSVNGALAVGGNGYTTIQAAVTAAGATGSVVILPTYTGSDSWTNPNNVPIKDMRPHNPNNALNYAAGPSPTATGPMPRTTIKAADYGAICNGVHDDTANIQAAVNALTTLIGGAGGGMTYMGPAAVELPQGRCEISSTIVMKDYGSLLGSPNGTWIYPLEPWRGGSNGDLVDITTSYVANASSGNHGGGVNRQVSGISFEYNYYRTAHTAINVISGYGNNSSTPYPNGQNNPQSYQIPNVTITGNYIYAMDQGIVLTDCGNCNVFNNWIQDVRVGIATYNSYSLVTRDNNLIGSQTAFTPIKGNPVGLFASSQGKYWCKGGTGAACTSGTVTQVISSPQGFSVFGTTVETFYESAMIENCIGLNVNDSSYFGDSYGPVGIHIGRIDGLQWHASGASIVGPNGTVMEIEASTTAPWSGSVSRDGYRIDTGIFSSDTAGGTSNGIVIDGTSSNYPIRNFDIMNNEFANLHNGVVTQSPLTQSIISGNYGTTNSGSLIVLDNGSSNSYAQTVIADNTASDRERILDVIHGTGQLVGYNSSASQVTGTFTATGSGCSIASSTVGTLCASAITMSLPVAFADTNYNVTSCALSGASGAASPTLIGGSKTTTTFTVDEVSQTTGAVSGGNIYCTVVHP